MKELGDRPHPELNPDLNPDFYRILNEVSGSTGVQVPDILGKGRFREFIDARQFVMYRLWTETDMPLTRIGMLLGGRDHSTIHHGIEKYTERAGVKAKPANERGKHEKKSPDSPEQANDLQNGISTNEITATLRRMSNHNYPISINGSIPDSDIAIQITPGYLVRYKTGDKESIITLEEAIEKFGHENIAKIVKQKFSQLGLH